MAKGSKVITHNSSYESSECESDDDLKPSYSKLVKIATTQQSAIERIQKLLNNSNDLLGEEMDRTQSLTEEFESLKYKYDNLTNRHVTLLEDHEKLSYEFLQRKQDLEKL